MKEVYRADGIFCHELFNLLGFDKFTKNNNTRRNPELKSFLKGIFMKIGNEKIEFSYDHL